jgi:NADPH-dependent 2,4-dienoyl-CoA reductase/sulfur reductase-like enzyme
VIATLREPATAAPAAPGGGIPEVPARVAGTVSAVRVSAGSTSPHQLRVELAEGGASVIDFEQAIIAAGSEPLTLPFIPASDPRIMDSTGALEVGEVPERLLILGGGIMGLEMATVYHELGAKVTIAELMDQLIPGADKDLISLLAKPITGSTRTSTSRPRSPASKPGPRAWWCPSTARTPRPPAPSTGCSSPWAEAPTAS